MEIENSCPQLDELKAIIKELEESAPDKYDRALSLIADIRAINYQLRKVKTKADEALVKFESLRVSSGNFRTTDTILADEGYEWVINALKRVLN